jgi:GntR family transcriptional repressor for pyruvate dehydrogenase complex
MHAPRYDHPDMSSENRDELPPVGSPEPGVWPRLGTLVQSRPAKSARPQKTAMLVAQRIMADVDRLSLQAGDHLPPERTMLEEYGVGRGTLRESLRFLELQGVLAIKAGPGGGPIVRHPDASNLATALVLLLQISGATFRAIAEARLALEPLMAAKAAEHITDEALAELQETLDCMRSDLENPTVFLEANKRFHDVIAWSSGNPVFGLMLDAMLDIIDGTVLGIDYPLHRRAAILGAHERIVEGLGAHNPATAEAAMRLHIHEYLVHAERKFPDVLNQTVTWQAVTLS